MPRSKPKAAAAPKEEAPAKTQAPVKTKVEKEPEYVAPKKKLFWIRPVKIVGYFMPISGAITEEHKNAFIAQVRLAMPADQFKNWDFSKWTTEVDKEAVRREKILAKRKADIGLT